MWTRRQWLTVAAAGAAFAQENGTSKFPLPAPEAPEPPVEFVCPMDPDIRSKAPGRCSRCGMSLVAGIPEQVEYPVRITMSPKVVKPGAPVDLSFAVLNPKTKKPVTEFEEVHERLYHMFIVSQDLQFFIHEHPQNGADSVFRYRATLPRAGMYRVLSDFYPKGDTPQLIASTLIVPGVPISAGAKLSPDIAPQRGENLTATLRMEPERPIAGMKTLMFFKLEPGDGMEKYLAAWGHMMAASGDLVDMIHTHPFLADGAGNVQFNVIFPRPGVHRVWVQFQRKGVVNTLAFNIPVDELRAG